MAINTWQLTDALDCSCLIILEANEQFVFLYVLDKYNSSSCN